MSDSDRAITYRWDELDSDEPMALLSRKRVIGTRAMISRVVLQKGCVVPRHAHENEQFACILSGCLKIELDSQTGTGNETVVVKAGELIHFPSNVAHAAEALEDTVVLDVFSPPSETTGIDRK